jgi:hypothetical protein
MSNNISKPECDGMDGIYLDYLEYLAGPETEDSESEFCGKYSRDCTLMSQLKKIDKSGIEDGCVTERDVSSFSIKGGLNLDAINYLYSLKERAIKFGGLLFRLAEKEKEVSGKPILSQLLINELPRVIDTGVTRIDVVEELMYVANQGYYSRDLVRANGAIPVMWDILSIGRKTIDWAFDTSSSMVDLYTEWAKGSLVQRNAAVSSFIQKAKLAVNTKQPINYSEEIIQNDFPIDLISAFINNPAGDAEALVSTMMEMAQWFRIKDNWVAARYIYNTISGNDRDTISFETAEDARQKLKEMNGNPENRSEISEAIFPPMPWHFFNGNLSDEQKYSLPGDWAGFGLSMIIGSKIFTTVAVTSRSIVTRFSRMTRLSTIDPKISATSLLARSEALAKMNPFTRVAVKSFDMSGRAMHWAWAQTGGLIGRTLRENVAPLVVAVGKPAVDAVKSAASNPKSVFYPPAVVGVGLARGVKWTLVTATSSIGGGWKGPVVTWWGLRSYGKPFINDMAIPGLEQSNSSLRKALKKYEFDWAIRETQTELRARGMDPLNRIIFKKIKRIEWERGDLYREQKKLEGFDVEVDVTDNSLIEKIRLDSFLKELGTIYIDSDQFVEFYEEKELHGIPLNARQQVSKKPNKTNAVATSYINIEPMPNSDLATELLFRSQKPFLTCGSEGCFDEKFQTGYYTYILEDKHGENFLMLIPKEIEDFYDKMQDYRV